jgi:esterase/lipase
LVPASELGLALVRELALVKDLEMELEKAKDLEMELEKAKDLEKELEKAKDLEKELEKELELVSAPASKLLHQKDQECSSAQVNQLVESPVGPSLLRNWSPTKAEHRSTMPEDASA